MPAYLVQLPSTCGLSLINGANTQVVYAATATQAKELAAARFGGDASSWSGATVTAIAAASDWSGWTFGITLQSGLGTGKDKPGRVSATGDATNNTVDKIAALLVTELVAAGIANAAYNASTNTLTVAAIADGIGDKTFTCDITPPSGYNSVPSLVGTLTCGGVSAAALTVVLPADAAEVPVSLFAGAAS